jgi:hypothetical protein
MAIADHPRTWVGLTITLFSRALLRPRLAADLLAVAWAFRRRAWYQQAPFLPVPSRRYLRWRMYTAYGDERAVPSPDDVARFAEWRRKLLHL